MVHDSIFTNRLTLVRFIPEHLFQEASLRRLLIFPLLDRVLGRLCLEILPKIHEKVQYLSALSLWNIEETMQ